MERGRLDPLGLLHRIREGHAGGVSRVIRFGRSAVGARAARVLEQFLAKLPDAAGVKASARPTHRKAESQSAAHGEPGRDPFESVWPEILLWLQKASADATGKAAAGAVASRVPGPIPERPASGHLLTSYQGVPSQVMCVVWFTDARTERRSARSRCLSVPKRGTEATADPGDAHLPIARGDPQLQDSDTGSFYEVAFFYEVACVKCKSVFSFSSQ